MGIKIIFFSFFLVFGNCSVAQYTVGTVPNQKLIDNSYVSDPDNYIDGYEKIQLNEICADVEQTTGAQIAVVVVGSIGNEVPHDFGLELFNDWGLGREGFDDGLLVILVMDQRRVEFITGYGMEQLISDGMSFEIQQNEMVPRFKSGQYGQGLIDGIRVCADIIKGGELPVYYASSTAKESEHWGFKALKFYAIYFVLPFFALYVLLFLLTFLFKNPYKKYKLIKLFELKIFMILLPIPFVGVYFLVKKQIEHWRNTVRFSLKSGLAMVKLSEEDDDKHLKKGQVTEEKVKSIDYDVWVGESDEDVLILSYIKWFSGHSKCPRCKFKTYYLVYNRTISAATYSSSGLGEKKHACENCGHSVVRTYTIPRLQKSSSSGGSSGSSGGSWGGGSSGGGGAGSSW